MPQLRSGAVCENSFCLQLVLSTRATGLVVLERLAQLVRRVS